MNLVRENVLNHSLPSYCVIDAMLCASNKLNKANN